MKRADVEREYNVVAGIIRSNGKFEGEAVYAPAFYDESLNGCVDSLCWPEPEGGETFIFALDQADRDEWSISPETYCVRLDETASGFIYCKELSEAQYDRLYERNMRAWERAETSEVE